MTLSDLGNIGEFIGSVGVVISLIYVGLQIRQNTESARDLSAQALTTTISEANSLIATSDYLAKIIQTGVTDLESLSENEQLRFNTFFFAAYNQFDFAYRRHSAGKLDDDSWKKMEFEIPTFLHLPGPRTWWERDKERFSPQFVAFVEQKLAEYVAPEEIPTFGRKQ